MIWKVRLTLSSGAVIERTVRAPTRGRAICIAVGGCVISEGLDVVAAEVVS